MKAYIGLGSNVGDRLTFLKKAISLIGDTHSILILRLSSVYETEPVHCEGLWFYNAVLEIETVEEPLGLLDRLLKIEAALGRVRSGKNISRSIDLDLLFYESHMMENEALTLPHPRLHERRFVLEPLSELDEHLIHPGFQETVGNLLKNLRDKWSVKKAVPIFELLPLE
ncbi:MAG: 2-amino-4-hydroxy-6-hydroxymethyldihydropteridine diphosphokinase [Chlamydiae bacterium]|nr:2-amino-4-hydroxy-6-hydroxymethyldihydropteridine diphosphokinase [Chlamydiota bacterium]MBI3265792.1 2-amino-4-hydroxy-6-hydroxymethyldihydropteridine diphosphokinase [Chlamydiota bacterium]